VLPVATVDVVVKHRSKRDRIGVGSGGLASVAVTSPAHDGRANRHVVKLLAKTLGVPQSAVRIVRGETARRKVIAIDALSGPEIRARLGEASDLKKG
jgi:hypothetical protein